MKDGPIPLFVQHEELPPDMTGLMDAGSGDGGSQTTIQVVDFTMAKGGGSCVAIVDPSKRGMGVLTTPTEADFSNALFTSGPVPSLVNLDCSFKSSKLSLPSDNSRIVLKAKIQPSFQTKCQTTCASSQLLRTFGEILITDGTTKIADPAPAFFDNPAKAYDIEIPILAGIPLGAKDNIVVEVKMGALIVNIAAFVEKPRLGWVIEGMRFEVTR